MGSIPQRTCIGCLKKKEKSRLLRLVRAEKGIIKIDSRGEGNGRGAYLCRRYDCWEKGKKRLSRALRKEIKKGDLDIIEREFERFREGNNE